MTINILPPDVSSKIAAGEVVERPASVVKELVENSLDAGASRIVIEVRGGGVNFISISDNGTGIPFSDMENAFHRYATSKIETFADLESVKTLGFRGEALHTIASVAQVDLVTCDSDNDSVGSYILLRGGVVEKKGRRGHPRGSTIIVRDLFREIPARLKFLKSTATENSHIVNVVTRQSFAFPNVRFTLFVDGKAVLRTSGNGVLRDVLSEVYGWKIAQAMLEVGADKMEGQDAVPRVRGLVSPPDISRASRRQLNFFVNKRWVRNAMLARAVEEAYHGLLMVGRRPLAVIDISIPPRDIDINVHPTKSEVKFSHEQSLFGTVRGVIRQVVMEQSRAQLPEVTAPFAFQPKYSGSGSGDIEGYSLRDSVGEELQNSPPDGGAGSGFPIMRVIGQMANAYIITEGGNGLYLVDQHAAHERVLFEQIQEQRANHKLEVQGLLEPIMLELDIRQEQLMKLRGTTLTQFGFSIEHFGGRAYLVRAIPAVIQHVKLSMVIGDIMDVLDGESSPQVREEGITISLACHGAVRAGKILSLEEMRSLIRQLEQSNMPRTCPHGRPTMIYFSSSQLAKEFGRTNPVSR
ncbi:MAG: DNA mismatch repair endonuclease MutL [Dehalococcoidia bacterium]|nr:DNA mismatch repair endonuclease MutL [Dehalococcoidia bacterium]